MELGNKLAGVGQECDRKVKDSFFELDSLHIRLDTMTPQLPEVRDSLTPAAETLEPHFRHSAANDFWLESLLSCVVSRFVDRVARC